MNILPLFPFLFRFNELVFLPVAFAMKLHKTNIIRQINLDSSILGKETDHVHEGESLRLYDSSHDGWLVVTCAKHQTPFRLSLAN